MRAIYFIILILSFSYFVFKKRYFDLFSLSFFSSLIYFLPALFGYVRKPTIDGIIKSKLISETYYIYILVILFILVGGIIFDIFITNTGNSKIRFKIKYFNEKYYLHSIVILGFLFFIIFFYFNHNELFSPGKPTFDRTKYLFIFTSIIGFIFTYLNNNKKIMLIFLLFLLLDVYGGNRGAFANSFLSLFVLHLVNKGPLPFYKQYNMIVFGFLGGIFIFAYKGIYQAILLGRWEIVLERITSLRYYISRIINSEPFIVQMILNETIKNSISLEINYLFNTLLLLIPFSNKLFTHEVTAFNDIFRDSLFSFVNYGLASNIWAEIWAIGNYFFIILALVFNFFILFFGSYMLIKLENKFLKVLLAIMSSYWIFYSNRTGILYQLTIQRRIIVVFLIIFLFAFMLSYFFMSKNKCCVSDS